MGRQWMAWRFIILTGLLGGLPSLTHAQFWGDTLKLPLFEYKEKRSLPEPGLKQKQISKAELKHYEDQSLASALAYESPAYIKSYGPGGLATPSFRGTGAGHTQITWNGIPLNSPMNGQVDLNLVPVAFMDGLTVQNGAGNRGQRPGGLGGRIRIEQTPDWQETPRFTAAQQVGSFGRQQSQAGIALGNDQLHSETQLLYRDYDNHYEFRDLTERGNPRVEQEHAALQQYGLMQELYYRPDTTNLFSVYGWFQQGDREIPPPMNGANQQQFQEDLQGRLMAEWQHFNQHSKWEVRSAFMDNRLHFTDEKVNIDAQHHSRSLLNSVNYTHWLDDDQRLEGGINYDYHWANSDGYEGIRTQPRLSGYASYRQHWEHNFSMRLRLQQEFVKGVSTPLIPHIGVTWRPFKQNNLALKASAYRNYKVPTLNDLYWATGGNPDLQPEAGWGQEAGLVYQHKPSFLMPLKHLKAEVTVYHGLYDQWIQWIPNPAGLWEAQNIQQVRIKGLESSIQTHWQVGPAKLTGGGAYSYTVSRNLKGRGVNASAAGRQLIYVPFHKVRGQGAVKWEGYQLRYHHRLVSRRYVTRDHYQYLPAYDRASLSLGKSFGFNAVTLKGRLKVQNLYDEQYQEMAWRPMPGRSYYLSLSLAYHP